MTADAIWGALVTGALAIVTLICGKCRCYVRQQVDGDGDQKAPEWACGFTEKTLVPDNTQSEQLIHIRKQ